MHVLPHGEVEDAWFLSHVGNLGSEGLEVEFTNFSSVNLDSAVLGLVESVEELEDGAFSTAGLSNEGYCLSSLYCETHVSEHSHVGFRGVGEAHILEPDLVLELLEL